MFSRAAPSVTVPPSATDLASPGAIGGTTPAAITATTLSVTNPSGLTTGLQVGIGSGVLSIGQLPSAPGWGAIYGPVTPGATNYAFLASSNTTWLGATSTVNIGISNTAKITVVSTAGAGPDITAGTATTAVNALSLTQTRNNSGVTFPGVTWTFTDTAVGGSSLLFKILGASSGTQSMLSLSASNATLTIGDNSGNYGKIVSGIGAGLGFFFGNRGNIGASADGVFRVANDAGTDFSRVCYGGLTSSFPATKRSGTTLAIRLADDSADAPLTASNITASGYIKPPSFTVATLPSASTSGAGAQIYVTDESGGACGAQSNGTNWKRLGTQTTIS